MHMLPNIPITQINRKERQSALLNETKEGKRRKKGCFSLAISARTHTSVCVCVFILAT